MSRWEPNAGGRLQQAALELFAEHGFEQTTVEDIATRAGLTKRTFFRHHADKREVLFAGGEAFLASFLDALAGVPASTPAMEAVAASVEAAGVSFVGRREYAARRQAVIAANAELRERELVKLASVAAALAGALRERGVPEPAASVAAEAGVAVFRIAFDRWVSPGEERELPELIRESLAALRGVAAGA